jgi:hypothetical protein
MDGFKDTFRISVEVTQDEIVIIVGSGIGQAVGHGERDSLKKLFTYRI